MTAQQVFEFTSPTARDSRPRARHNDPSTSKAAAARMAVRSPSLRQSIVDCLAMYGPASDDRICLRLNIDPRRWPSVKTARSALSKAQNPLVVATDRIEHGQRVWAHRDFRSYVEEVTTREGIL